jgi:hypothetical protein
MNTNGLTRHYDKLTAWERLPLMLAALNRGDDAEMERLAFTAPTRSAGVPHYHGLWEGLALLSVCHQMVQLERICALFAATGLLAAGKVGQDEGNGRLRLLAFRFVVAADAWKLLSAELHLDPVAMLCHLPGCEAVRDTEEAARQVAFTPEEALAYLRSRPEAEEATAGGTPAAHSEHRLDTAADLAREMRAYLAARAGRWL